jgi:glycosyltransferase involved in cell wall biosynthesis
LAPNRIIVVDDSESGLGTGAISSYTSVTLVQGGRGGAAQARNIGIANSTGDWIAFLDDDDEWEAEKLRTQLSGESHFAPSILASGARVQSRIGSRTRPRKTVEDNISLLTTLYGEGKWYSSPFYIPTPSIIVQGNLARGTPFDEELTAREDIWWLHQLQMAGGVITQIREPLLRVNVSYERGNSRDPLENQLAWARRLSGIDARVAAGFLRGAATRGAIVAGNFTRITELERAAKSYMPGHSSIRTYSSYLAAIPWRVMRCFLG